MPNQRDIISEIEKYSSDHSPLDFVRRKYLNELNDFVNVGKEEKDKRDTIIYASSYLSDNVQSSPSISIIKEDIRLLMAVMQGLKKKNLDILLHSPGGTLEATEQIVNYLRGRYKNIRVIVPMSAMSAATMLACAADEIIITKHGSLGPIDPQYNGISVKTIISEFELAEKNVIANPNAAALWLERIRHYPSYIECQGVLNASQNRVSEWLTKYMQLPAKTAENISKWLANADEHGLHGRPICFEELKSHGLKVSLLEDNQEFQEKVLPVFHAMMATFDNAPCVKIVENQNGIGRYLKQ
ncbi:MAG: ATP-dependent Clp protease proteolytic subunit [Rickettsiales bacterium]|jgi:hypothetical protein|nr:ATP-dependent Clp protease proteolytic subunit [Rickettsiales bacterium]